MSWLRAGVKELFRLFVDDGLLALMAVLWIGLNWLILPTLVTSGAWRGAGLLFLGLALLLGRSVLLAAGQQP